MINPVFTIWYNPRGAIRSVLARYPEWLTLPMSALFGVIIVLPITVAPEEAFGTIPKVAVVRHAMWVAPIALVAAVYLQGAMVAWSSRRAGSTAPPHAIRAALAWARLPIITWFLLLAVAERLVLAWRAIHPGPAPAIYAIGVFGCGAALICWSFAIRRECLHEVRGLEPHQARHAMRLRMLAYGGATAVGAIAAVAERLFHLR